jgi:Peptidase A4 family
MKRHRLFASAALAASAIVVAALNAASASADTVASQAAVSQNWAGYVASGKQFSSVSGSWVQPTAKCGSGQTYSAFWVGLGGSGQSSSLEQTGTQADCNADGSTDYYAWYELVPAAPVKLDLAIQPGDHIAAKVSVSGTDVTVSLTDQTTGRSTTKTLQMDSPDTSSAEWIAEAPSACDGSGSCQPLPLSDFGTVQFTGSSATADGHTGPISDPEWSAQAVVLGSGGASDVSYAPDQSSAGATPTSLSSDGSSFAVAYQGSSGTSGAAGGSGDYGYGDGGDSSGGYPGGDGSYGYGGYPGGYGQGGYGGYGDGGYGYGYGAF